MASQQKTKQPYSSRTCNSIYILAIVYLVPVTEKAYLQCFVGKKRYRYNMWGGVAALRTLRPLKRAIGLLNTTYPRGINDHHFYKSFIYPRA